MARQTAIADIKRAMRDEFGDGSVRAMGSFSMDKLIGVFQSTPPARGSKETLKMYSAMPWLRACADKIGSSIATMTWRVFVKVNINEKGKRVPVRNRQLQVMDWRQRQGEFARLKSVGQLVEIEDHPVIDSLYATGPVLTGYTNRELTQKWLDLVGEAFWVKERNGSGMPIGFIPIPPTWVSDVPKDGKGDFIIDAPDTKTMAVPFEDMIWFYHPDPYDPYSRGSGMGYTLGDELETDEYAAKFMKQFFYNSARPDFMISSNELKREDTMRLERRFLDKLRGWRQSFLPFFLNRDVKVHNIGTDYSHLQMLDLRKAQRDTVIQVYGVPPEVMGIVEASNRATSEVAEYLYARWVLTPRLEFIRQILQHFLIPDYDDRLILDYDSPVAQDKEHILKVATIAPFSLTVDEWRIMQGLLPLPDGAGQVFMKPLNYEAVLMEDLKNPYSQQGPDEPPADQNPANEPPPEDGDAEDNLEDDTTDTPTEEQQESINRFWPELVVNAVSRQRVTPKVGTRSEQIAKRLDECLSEISDAARHNHETITSHLDDALPDLAIGEVMRAFDISTSPLVQKLTSIYLIAAEIATANLAFFAQDDEKIAALEPLFELDRARNDCERELKDAIKKTLDTILEQASPDIPIGDLTFLLIDGIGIKADDVQQFLSLGGEGDDVLPLYGSFVDEMGDHLITHMCNAAMEALWSESVREGILDPNRVARVWITRRGCRSCDECKGMDGVSTTIDMAWKLPEGGTVVTPTKAHKLCHCTEQLVRKEARK
jgi:hypothetical protein